MIRLALLVGIAACSAKAATWAPDERAAFDRARAEHRGVMLELWTSWAVPAEELDRELRGDRVGAALRDGFVPVRIDVSDDSPASAEVRARYRADTLPALVFVTTDGAVIERLDHLVDEPELTGIVERATAKLHPRVKDPSGSASGPERSGTMHP